MSRQQQTRGRGIGTADSLAQPEENTHAASACRSTSVSQHETFGGTVSPGPAICPLVVGPGLPNVGALEGQPS